MQANPASLECSDGVFSGKHPHPPGCSCRIPESMERFGNPVTAVFVDLDGGSFLDGSHDTGYLLNAPFCSTSIITHSTKSRMLDLNANSSSL